MGAMCFIFNRDPISQAGRRGFRSPFPALSNQLISKLLIERSTWLFSPVFCGRATLCIWETARTVNLPG